MTIVINLCWADKMGYWFGRNENKIQSIIIYFIMFAGIPSFIFGSLMYSNLIPSTFEGQLGMRAIDWIITFGSMIYGAIASIFAIVFTKNYLEGQNEKKHWFEIKHCDEKENCD